MAELVAAIVIEGIVSKPPIQYRPKPRKAVTLPPAKVGKIITIEAGEHGAVVFPSNPQTITVPPEESAEAILARIREKTRLRVQKHRASNNTGRG